MPHVIAIIGARLNSSRLPGKHLLNLAGKPLIYRIFQRLEQVSQIDEVILATTADATNQPLVAWCEANQKQVFAFDGDVNNLTGRLDAIISQKQPDCIVYVCGDSPLIEPRTLSRLIQALFEQNAEAAYVGLKDGAPSIHEGFDVYSASLWNRIVAMSKTPTEREHVGVVLRPIFEELRKAIITDDSIFYRLHHRLSVDTPSDYQFMETIYDRWHAEHSNDVIVDLPAVISWLEKEPDLRAINGKVRQKTPVESSLRVLLLVSQGPTIGLGHLTRTIRAARALQDAVSAGVALLIAGPPLEIKGLRLIPHRFTENLSEALEAEGAKADVIISDLHHSQVDPTLLSKLGDLKRAGVRLASIDFCLPKALVHLNWVPSFYMRPGVAEPDKHRYGWDCYLLESTIKTRHQSNDGPVIAALSGGSDAFGLGSLLPKHIDALLPEDCSIIWVQGPYAPAPDIPANPRLIWTLMHNPSDLNGVLAQCSHAITVYGVSFFECLAAKLTTVVITPNQDPGEMAALDEAQAALRFEDPLAAVTGMANLLHGTSKKPKKSPLREGGPERLALAIRDLAGKNPI